MDILLTVLLVMIDALLIISLLVMDILLSLMLAVRIADEISAVGYKGKRHCHFPADVDRYFMGCDTCGHHGKTPMAYTCVSCALDRQHWVPKGPPKNAK